MLRIKHIQLRDFRSYERFDLEIPGRLTVFAGPNAIGKTNIVEAVQLLTATQTFRHARSADLLRHGTAAAHAHIDVSDGNRLLQLALAIDERSRRYTLNGKPKRRAEMCGLVPSVAFTPDDLDLVKGAPAKRRDALDALGAQLNSNYHVILSDFEKALKCKNRILKDGQEEMLDAVNDIFAQVGVQLSNYRRALFARLEPKIVARYKQISGGELMRGNYEVSWGECEDVTLEVATQVLAAARERELAARRTLVGPNHDRVAFTINDMDAQAFASQGQQRSAVLAWKLAEAETIEEMLHTVPILLLDDVMSELDSARREALVDYLQGPVQAFITTANLDYFEKNALLDAHVVQLPLQTA